METPSGPRLTPPLKFTESPRWYNGKLWFLDIHDTRIKTVDPAGAVATVPKLPFISNGSGSPPREPSWLAMRFGAWFTLRTELPCKR